MTPELKIACEVVFQEHKITAQPVKWKGEAFRGRISIGLSEMAKETLVSKNIIYIPDKTKKIFTLLNPVVSAATNFEEAEEMLAKKTQALLPITTTEENDFITQDVPGFEITNSNYSHRHFTIAGTSDTAVAGTKWYLKPLFFYVVWPVCGALAGAFIAYLIGFVYTKLFFDLK
jgi:hypothetical protein